MLCLSSDFQPLTLEIAQKLLAFTAVNIKSIPNSNEKPLQPGRNRSVNPEDLIRGSIVQIHAPVALQFPEIRVF